MVATLGEVEHVPPERAELACTKAMAVGDQDHRRVAVRVAGTGALASGGDEARHLLGGEILARSALGVGEAPRGNFPIFSYRPSPFPRA